MGGFGFRFRFGHWRRDPCPRMQSVSEKRLFSARIAKAIIGIDPRECQPSGKVLKRCYRFCPKSNKAGSIAAGTVLALV